MSYIIEGTNQEIFDRVVEHLAQQKKRSMYDKDTCAYRSEDGLKCAIGALIPDEYYDSEFEEKNISTLIEIGIIKTYSHRDLLQRLQIAHDESLDLDQLKDKLTSIAVICNLNPDKIALITEWS